MKTINKLKIISYTCFTFFLTLNYSCTDPIDKPNGSIMGTVNDKDGNVYKTVKIGSQVWMAENLKTTKYNDGTEMTNVTSNTQWSNLTTGAYCNYDNLESNVPKYGRLYNWYAVKTGKLAPIGWHVATDEDWTILKNYLIANGYNYDGTKDVNKIAKALASTTGWELSRTTGTPGAYPEGNNSTGFAALPGGSRSSSGAFDTIGLDGVWWSSTEGSTVYAWGQSLSYYDLSLSGYYGTKSSGFSVRCLRDL